MGQTRFCFNVIQGSDPNVACDTASQYGDHFHAIVLKWNFR